MRSIITIRKRRSVGPILFCSFLPPSSSPPHPSSTLATPSLLHPPSTVRNGFGMPPVLYGSTAITDQLTPAPSVWLIIGVVRKTCPLRPSAPSYPSRTGHSLRAGNNTVARVHTNVAACRVLRGGTRRTWIWACLKYLRFLRRVGGRYEGTHWVNMCAAAQLHALARQ
ncbi:hypothetical protein B0H14DRAFT_2607726 [Mycena olivaceomarginata]|nr:hypothetical protein B0H14DRAFT_2607726 [Mycena olivaceomarginata]